jgi:16S rRNA (adenine1518-N6/adenine1519-N6)-dimethyltransferase
LSHKARKRFGQNFLQDRAIIERIIDAISPDKQQHLVEIGPGKGALTDYIVQSGCRVDVIELDRDLVPYLEEKYSSAETFKIHSADALQFNICTLIEPAAPLINSPAVSSTISPTANSAINSTESNKIRLVGNLPYNISTPLIFHLLEQIECISDMHFMLQKEVVERLTAQPGTKQYGRLSILVQYLCQTESLFFVPPGAFNTAPKVDSAIIRLIPYASSYASPYTNNRPDPGFGETATTDLVYIAKNAFAQRRKTLRNNLRGILSEEQIKQCSIEPSRRAETLSIEEFVRLSNAYARSLSGYKSDA